MAKPNQWSTTVRITNSTLASVNVYWGQPEKLFFFGLDDEGRPFTIQLGLSDIAILQRLLELAKHAEKTGRVLVLHERLSVEMPDEQHSYDGDDFMGRGPVDPNIGAQLP